MAAGLQDQLAALHACLQGGYSVTAAEKANDIVGDIGHLVLQDVPDKEMDYCCSVLFDKDSGVVAFLKKTVAQDEFQYSKSGLLEMLLSFVRNRENKILPYAVDIKDVCLSLFTRDRLSRVKSGAIPLLIEVIQQTSGSKIAEDLQVNKMIEKFFMELTKAATKHTPTVKAQIYQLLGLFAEVYPELMINYSEKLLDLYMRTLREQMTSKTKKPELSIIAGCLQGLTSLLIHFTHSAEEGGKHAYDIFKYTKMATDKDVKLNRYDMPRAGLKLLAKHAGQFDQYLIDDHQGMYEKLAYWSSHHNREMQHLGMLALEGFLKQISQMLVEQAKRGKKDGATFKFFIQKFRAIMDNPQSTNKEINLAIRGYGFFAAPCKLFLSTNDVKFMFNEMIQRSEQVFFGQSDELEDKLINLPSFLEALASIITHLDTITENFLLSLERLVVILIENYPKLHEKLYFGCYLAVLKVFFALSANKAVFKGFLSRVVYQGLIRTCSHPVVLETEEHPDLQDREEMVEQDKQQKVSYRDYLGLWFTLLDSAQVKELAQLEISLEERHVLTEAIYDELISAVLKIVDRLDLTSNRGAEGEAEVEASTSTSNNTSQSPEDVGADPVDGLQPARPKDFIIFINLVDFSRDLLPKKHVEMFHKWAFTFGRDVILQSTRHPLVSGFYKLLAVCMRICSKTAYFKEVNMSNWSRLPMKLEDVQGIKKEEPDSMEVDFVADTAADLAQKEACYVLFRKFTKEVLTRMKQYKDELLAACLVFILSLPKEVIMADLPAIIPAVKTAFRIGQSYLPLAAAGLDALEHWARSLPPHVLLPYYKEILPCLDAYLRTTLDSGSDVAGGDQTLALTSSNPGKKVGRKKIPIKLLKKKKEATKKVQESQLAQVKQRCLFLLGSLGGAVNSVLVSTETQVLAKDAVAWDSTKHLKFDMPFMDIKPTIYFDVFLPRLVQLATTSSDRQTKVAACELLHSLVLYMLGRGAQQPGGPRKSEEKQPMDALYRRLFPVVMQLACDVEQVSKDLFEPLLMQLIHWFTSSKKFESPDVRALLDALMDGLVCPTDTALRDISARAVKEFFKWSVKQSTKKQLEKNPVNVLSLLKRMYGLARHPSAFKRLGAALAFNNIYTIFREEDCLVSMFTFEILVVFVESLAIAHADDKSLGTQEQCKLALNHLERVIKVKAKLLVPDTKNRRKPKGWNLDVTLLTCIRWLLRQCGRPQTECRHACMELVYKLAPCIDGVETPKAFFDALLEDSGPSYYITRFESGVYKLTGGKSGLLRRPTMAHMDGMFSVKTALNWFDLVLASLDCYSWVFGERLLSPAKTLITSGNKGTVIFQVLTHFFTSLALEDINAAAKLFKSQPATLVFTPREIDDYNRAKCTVLVRVMNFLCVMLGGYRNESLKIFPGNFFSPSMWDTIVSCVLEPRSVGFNMGDLEIMMRLPEETQQLLTVFNKCLPANLQKGFNQQLAAKISKNSHCDLFGKLPLNFQESSQDFVHLSHLVCGFEQLQKTGMLAEALKDAKMKQKFADQLLDCVFKGLVTADSDGKYTGANLDPTSQTLAERLLKLAFLLGVKSDRLLDVLLDKTELVASGSKTTGCHGDVFYATFKSVINSHLVGVAKAFLPPLIKYAQTEWSTVGSVLMGMIDQVGRDKQLRRKEGAALVDLVLGQWDQLSCWWNGTNATQETKSQSISLLTKMIVINSKVVSDGTHPAFPEVFTMYLDLLTDTKTALAFKSRVMDLLPFFASLPERESKQLKSRLDRLVADNFPARSTEYEAGSPKYNDYITALKKILYALELSGSLTLLEILISIMCKEPRHVYEDEIQNSLARFVKRLPKDKHKAAADVPYKIFINDKRFTNDQRRSALERVCLSILRLVSSAALTLFFMNHIVDIVETIEAKQVKTSESAMETQVVSKLCCFQLVEIMYSRLPKDDVFSKTSKINEVFCRHKVESGKELTTRIMKTANTVKAEDMRGEKMLLEPRRNLHCAAYNALMAIVCCTQTDLKFYKGFLFQDDTAKGQFLLENLVDKDRHYTFEVEMSTPLARRKKFVSIRNEVRENRDAEDGEGQYTTSVHYLASQYLADSSLSADVSQFDFGSSASASAFSMSGSAPQASLGGYERVYRRDSQPKDNVQEAVVTVKDDYVEMEMDELNQHECMASLTALLQHMKRNKITPQLEKGEAPTELPSWMSYFHRKMQSHETPLNVKLFICKLIVNTEEVFRPYAKFWLAPIVAFICRGELGTEGIHYFVVDLVVTILSWHTVAIPEDNAVDRAMASRLAEFLTSRCHHDSRQVLRNNLQVLKTLVEVWKTSIDVPTKVCFENFNDRDPKTKKNAAGLQMAGVFLANKISPFRSGCSVEKDKFYQFLAMNMLKDYKETYAPAAEVVGMSLKHMAETDKSTDGKKWQETYVDNIAKMLTGLHAAKPDQFITCVHRMQQHYAPVSDKFVGKMLFMLPKVHGEFKTHCLEIILNRVGSVDNIFVEMKSKGITDILSHRDEDTQTVALKLVKEMLRYLAPAELLFLLPSVTAFTSAPSATCRGEMYDILKWIYDNYREESSEEGNKIITMTKECLLQGLSDDNLKNRLTIQNFWSHETRLPTGTLDRMVAMLEAMYSPSTESQYLAYATNLLLEMTSKSPDYNREIFEHPLSECKFEDYNVSSSWRQRHAAMTPMFAQTQGTQSEIPDDSVASVQIRATQDVQQFTATQDVAGGGKGPYNWLTQSSMDTFSDYSQSLATDTQSSSSLLFTVGKSGSKPAGKRTTGAAVGPGFGKDRMGGSKDQTDGRDDSSQSSEILRLKKRFIRDQESSHLYFIKRASRMAKMREQIQREQKQRREHQVTMYRKYRTGELPDIQIKFSYVIAPLQALAQKDSAMARLLFSAIFKAIFAKIEDEKTEREARETVDKINDCLNNMLAESTQYHPPFMGCVLDIAQEYPKKITLKAENIHTVCTTSLQQPLGIVLMEDMLIQSEGDGERPEKRARGARGAAVSASVSRETGTWVELARLYKSLGDYDVLRGIFSSKFGTQKLTMEAMEAEMRADYQAAAKLYSQGLGASEDDYGDDRPNEVEMDLWEDSRLQCYDNLTEWGTLEKIATMSIDERMDLDKVWEDTYLQDHHLPFLLRGKLKLLLEGDEKQDSLLKFVDRAVKVPERKALLESQYCEELALMYIWQEDYDRARHYAASARELFLRDWSSIDSLMATSRTTKLQTLQKLTELQEFLDLMAKESNFESHGPSLKLMDRWLERSPDALMDPPGIWDDVITNRCVFIDQISERLQPPSQGMDVDDSEDDGTALSFSRRKVLLRLSQADSAREQDNFPVTLKILKKTLSTVRRLKDDSLQVRWAHTYAKTHHRKCLVAGLDLEDKVTALTGTLDNLAKQDPAVTSCASPSLKQQHNILKGDAIRIATQVLQKDVVDFGSLEADTRRKLHSMSGCTKNKHDEVVNSLIEKGYQHMKTAASLASQEEGVDPGSSDVNQALLALVKYCDNYLRQTEDEEDSPVNCGSFNSFPTAIVTSLLQAMKNNSLEARQLFPRLLQLIEYYPETMDTFARKSQEVPSWMFLSWIGQMTALLDKPESPAIQDMLLSIAEQYPNAMIYPFRMSSDSYQFTKDAVGKKSQEVKERLGSLLNRNKLVDLLISALEQFSQPDALFKDWYIDPEIRKLLNSSQKDKSKIKAVYKEMFEELMAVRTISSEDDLYDTQGGGSSSLPSSVGMGAYRQRFAKAFIKDMEKLFGKDGVKLQGLSYKEFFTGAKALAEKMTNEVKTKDSLRPPKTLKEYSTFLTDFQAGAYEQELEVPGQYKGLSKPLPEYHTRISSFDERVMVMSSLRRPKTVTIRGNDEKEHMFLVKGGEDLRQDQRIEQLFHIMNEVFVQDPVCRQRRLYLRTYEVVPMTPRVGLIEWMKHTIPLKEFLYNAMTDQERVFLDSNKGPRILHRAWIRTDNPEDYHKLYKNCSRADTLTEFRKKENLVPWNLLRKGYQQMSASSEAFFTLKCNFAISHAQLSMCQYVLGIGDRHLSNFMIDTETGKMVGIDFGHAFGSATQFLPIPELMPIRMTRQIRNLIMPLREKGLMEGTMVHTLRALRKNSDLLLNTMDIFIKEPSVDWKTLADKQMKNMVKIGMEVAELENDMEWYPKQKIAYARKKLEGYNPAYITRDELRLGHVKTPYCKFFEKVVMGEKDLDIRARLPKENLTVEQQVACLLNQATDPNILGRAWIGWESWM